MAEVHCRPTFGRMTHEPGMSRPASPALAGLAYTLASAAFLAGLGVTTQLAYEAGASVGTLLSGRFLVAAALMWPLVWLIIRPARPVRRQVAAGLLLGAGYSAHAWLFSASLARLDAGLVDLLLFTYPALVMLGAVALRRERWSVRGAAALAVAMAGTTLVLVGGIGSIDPLGVALALGSAVAYAGYILISAGQLERIDPFLLTALVTSGAAITLTAAGIARHDVSVEVDGSVVASIAVVGLVATAGMSTFVAGIGRLGPSRASIVSAVQPALTPVVGLAVFGDRLGPTQVLGGMLVIAAVVVLETHRRRSPVFSWLPRRERWRLARAATAIEVPAGTQVVRQGAPADAFFLIDSGSATVTRDTRHIDDLAPGDFFGELALLRDRARTASVVAATDMRVRVVSRDQFWRSMGTLPTLARSVRAAAVAR
jgi:drug/metabolite transporter (DMT)-like permease